MDRLWTPLLRRIYAAFAVFVFLYFGVAVVEYSSWNKERLYKKLLTGSPADKTSAGFDLAYLNGEGQLLRALRSSSPDVRAVAISSLWDLWVRAAGHGAFRKVQAANAAIARKAFPEALQILTTVTTDYPEFPEGWNRRATLYWQLGQFEKAVADARRVVRLNPNHFGAWQGMGLCQVHLGNLEEGCRCIRTALRITPHDEALQRFLDRCEQLLHLLSPSEKHHDDMA